MPNENMLYFGLAYVQRVFFETPTFRIVFRFAISIQKAARSDDGEMRGRSYQKRRVGSIQGFRLARDICLGQISQVANLAEGVSLERRRFGFLKPLYA